jgi:hypothetical protein
MKIFGLLFVLLSSVASFAQHVNFNSQKNWSLNKKELQFGLGATQFNGDLGGGSTYGIDYSPKDIDWASTGISGLIGFRYRFHPMLSTSSSLSFFTLKGDDKYSQESIRNARNLSFKSGVFEVQQKLELILFSKEQFSPSYNLPGAANLKNKNIQAYIFGGIGFCYFNPKAEYNGDWVALRPLKTEGVNYKPFSLTVPAGLGFRVGISNMWRIGMEVSYVKTFSDYIDDVSTNYISTSQLSSQMAIDLADRSNGNTGFVPGSQRGDSKQNDAYYHLNIIITRNITYKDYGKQRKKIEATSSKYKV